MAANLLESRTFYASWKLWRWLFVCFWGFVFFSYAAYVTFLQSPWSFLWAALALIYFAMFLNSLISVKSGFYRITLRPDGFEYSTTFSYFYLPWAAIKGATMAVFASPNIGSNRVANYICVETLPAVSEVCIYRVRGSERTLNSAALRISGDIWDFDADEILGEIVQRWGSANGVKGY
jgi:hypothetical protein